MPTHGLELFGRLGFSMVLGTTLIILATATGWLVAGFHGFFYVRWVNFWVKRVVIPLIQTPSWSRRTLTIFANNTLVLAAILLLGSWGISSRLGVILAGLSLGFHPARPDGELVEVHAYSGFLLAHNEAHTLFVI